MEVVDTNVPPPVVPTVPAAAPAAPAAPAAKKVRKPRTPKVKPPKKERVLLGGVILGTVEALGATPGIFHPLEIQPPGVIANDVTKVERWAEGVEALSKVQGKIFMYRRYNAILKVHASTKLEAEIEFIKEEVQQNQQTV